MANWSVSPSTNVNIDQSTGKITFPKNTSTTNTKYTITYTDNGCTATKEYIIPKCDNCKITNIVSMENGGFPSFGGSFTGWLIAYEVTRGSDVTSGSGEANFYIEDNPGGERQICIGTVELSISALYDESGTNLLDTCDLADGICFTQDGKEFSCSDISFSIGSFNRNVKGGTTCVVPLTGVGSSTFTVQTNENGEYSMTNVDSVTSRVYYKADRIQSGNNGYCSSPMGTRYLWYQECTNGNGINCGCTGGTSGTSSTSSASVFEVFVGDHNTNREGLAESPGSRSTLTVNGYQCSLSIPNNNFRGYLNDCCNHKVSLSAEFEFKFKNGKTCNVGVEFILVSDYK